jgi:hypothetical protein
MVVCVMCVMGLDNRSSIGIALSTVCIIKGLDYSMAYQARHVTEKIY